MANRDDFNKIISSLIGGDNFIPFEGFDASALGKFAEHQDVFWEGVLKYMQNEDVKNELTHFGIRQNDFPNDEDSVVEFINNKADLSEEFIGKLLENTNKYKESDHWNESFKKLMGLYGQIYRFADETIDSTNITYDDIRHADAGHSFKLTQEWVKPWMNVDKKDYGDVRASDKILRVLTDEKKLQFTNIQHMYMRLLMPEYERIVEVEDLNRNFWVIGQVITGILSFLFDPNNPLNKLLDGMLDEITQLWENMLYLWAMLTLISEQYLCQSVQPIVTPVYNDQLRPYVKFDNFNMEFKSDKAMLEDCWKKLSYLKDNYSDSTLVIIPEIRQKNYQENYYKRSYYPGIIVYDRQNRKPLIFDKNKVETIDDINKGDVKYFSFSEDGNKPFIIEIDKNGGIISGGKENNREITLCGLKIKPPYYNFIPDFSKLEDPTEQTEYIAAIRTVFDNVLITRKDNGEIDKINCSAKMYDITHYLYCKQNNQTISSSSFDYSYINKQTEIKIETKVGTAQKSAAAIKEGFYRGEMPSWYNIFRPSFSITVQKKWNKVPDETQREEEAKKDSNWATFDITLKRKKGYDGAEIEAIEVVGEPKTITYGDSSVTFSDCPAYDSSNVLYKYFIEETSKAKRNEWSTVYSNNEIDYEHRGEIICTNNWDKITYEGSAIGLSMDYNDTPIEKVPGNKSGYQIKLTDNIPNPTLEQVKQNVQRASWTESQNTVLDLLYFDKGFEDVGSNWITDSRAHWKKLVELSVKEDPVKQNQMRFYYSHLGYKQGTSGYFEGAPFCSVVINSGGIIDYCHYIIRVENNDDCHNKIKFPHGSANYNTIVTYLLCQYATASEDSNKISNVDSGVSMITPNATQIKNGFKVIAPTGYMVNGKMQYTNPNGHAIKNVSTARDAMWNHVTNSVSKIMSKNQSIWSGGPAGNVRYNSASILPSFEDGIAKLLNFIINVWDRAAAGSSNWKDVYPYYYKCSISVTADITQGRYGIIKAEPVYNNIIKPDDSLIRSWEVPNNLQVEEDDGRYKIKSATDKNGNPVLKYLTGRAISRDNYDSSKNFNTPEIGFLDKLSDADQYEAEKKFLEQSHNLT